MKLSKKQLTDFIVGSMRDNGENGWGSGDEHSALEALRTDSLEIEGYERSGWTRFNPKDPSTRPPKGQHFIAYGSGYMSVIFRYSSETETDEKFANRFSVRYGFTHWRPLPNPPVETEEK